MMIKNLFPFLMAVISQVSPAQESADKNKVSFYFDFGHGVLKKGFKQVHTDTEYTEAKGFGFLYGASLKSIDRPSENPLTSDFITSDKPFYFSVAIPEGNYNIKVYLGDSKDISNVTIRAECRRLMVPLMNTRRGETVQKAFTVHVRNATVNGKDSIKLKQREFNFLHWDNQLTLEFNGTEPKVAGLEINPADDNITTIFLAGNSTVVDQAEEPYAAWGQIIPSFFKPGKVVVANYAESGETLRAFKNERRLEKILGLMKPGDYLFIEFAHNDQKPGGNFLDAFTSYKETLKEYINIVRKKGAHPVLVTSMHRRQFDETGRIVNTLGNYPEAVRQTGREENVPVIDLNAMSKTLYEAWGPESSLKAFVHYPAGTFPNQVNDLKDNTHFSPYGAWQLAKCVVEGMKSARLPVASELIDNLPSYDPALPDPVESWVWPLSLRVNVVKPDGN